MPLLKKPNRKIKKHKLTAKGWIALCLILGAAAVLSFVYISRPTAIDKLSLTYLDQLTSQDLAYELQDSYEDKYEISDYTIYGESLVFYHGDYATTDYDPLYGKNFLLQNIETGQEQTFTYNGGADGGIDLGSLEPGVYEVYVYDKYTKKRLYASEPFESAVLTTMRRNKEVNDVVINADSTYLKKFGVDLDENYLFLTVSSSLPKVKVVDVMIDPSGLVSYLNSTGYADGYSSDIINENVASYTLALHIQDYLSEAGLRVEITRENNGDKGYYGSGSRVGLGYQKQAKVFLALTMTETDVSYPFILTSPYTYGGLANEIAYDLSQNGIELTTMSSLPRLNNGVGYDTLITDDNYQYTHWSLYPQIRESGGKITYAGTGEYWGQNSNFSGSYGMYGILFSYASTENPDSQVYFLENQEAIARSIAQGILDYFHIPQPEGQ